MHAPREGQPVRVSSPTILPQSKPQLPDLHNYLLLRAVPWPVLSEGYLGDLLLQRGWGGAVLVALSFTLTVATLRAGGSGGGGSSGGSGGGIGDVGPTGVTQFLLLITGLVLMFVVQHRFKVHHGPGVPGLGAWGESQKQT